MCGTDFESDGCAVFGTFVDHQVLSRGYDEGVAGYVVEDMGRSWVHGHRRREREDIRGESLGEGMLEGGLFVRIGGYWWVSFRFVGGNVGGENVENLPSIQPNMFSLLRC